MQGLLDCEPLASLMPLYKQKTKLGHRSGHYLSRIKGRGMVFSEVRAYQPGDDVRAIDWRVTARTGKAHTKLYQEERERPLFVLLDLSPSMLFGSEYLLKSSQAAYLAATACWAGIKAQDRVGLVVSGLEKIIENKPAARKRGLLKTLENIQTAHSQHIAHTHAENKRVRLTESLKRLRYHAHTGSLILVISDFFDMNKEAYAQLQQLGKHNQVILQPVSDPLELNLPDTLTGNLNVTDGSNVQVLNFGTASQQKSVEQGLTDYRARLEQALLELGYPCIPVSSALPLVQQLGGKS